MSEWWDLADTQVEQGHLFPEVLSPRLNPKTMTSMDAANPKVNVAFEIVPAITATQSCDFRNDRIKRVLLFRVLSLTTVREKPYNFTEAQLQEIRDNRRPSWLMLAAVEDEEDRDNVMLVDFRHPIMLPLEYIKHLASSDGGRPALRSPYLEYFSSAVGQYYSRVALNIQCPNFIDEGSNND